MSLGNRKSLVPTTNNRLSIYGSMTQIKDSRPLRDKNYQMQLQQDILDFLSYKNLFEIEMKHPLTNKTLKQPTQKDFVLIFQWLYKKIDPGYKFQKTVEQEVYFLLKTIRYPYLESINKSQIAAVGGQHWPTFLGMLHWMVQLNLTLMKLDDDETEILQESEQEDETDVNDLADSLFTKYILKSYKAFLNSEDDYSEYRNQLNQEFEQSNLDNLDKITLLNEKITALTLQYEKVRRQNDIINSASNKSKVLKDDTVKFKDYIDKMEQRKTRWSDILTDIKTNIEKQESELSKTNEQKQDIYKQLNELGFTVSDLDKMSQDRERLTKNLENCNLKFENTTKIVKDKERSFSDAYYKLEAVINGFNSTMYKISNAFNLKEVNQQFDFEINSFDIKLLSDECLGWKPDAMIPELKQNDIKTNLFLLKEMITSKTHQLQDETIKLQEELDIILEASNQKTEELATLENALSSSKVIYDQLYENFNQENSNSNLEVEKLQRDLQIMNIKKQESTLSVNQKFNNIKLEYETLKQDLNFKRLEVHNRVEKYLELIISFKLNIQAGLEDYEDLVIEECEKEFNKQEIA